MKPCVLDVLTTSSVSVHAQLHTVCNDIQVVAFRN